MIFLIRLSHILIVEGIVYWTFDWRLYSVNCSTLQTFCHIFLIFYDVISLNTFEEPAMRGLNCGLIINRIKPLQKSPNGQQTIRFYVIMTLGNWFENTLPEWYMLMPPIPSVYHGPINNKCMIPIDIFVVFNAMMCWHKSSIIIYRLYSWYSTGCIHIKSV